VTITKLQSILVVRFEPPVPSMLRVPKDVRANCLLLWRTGPQATSTTEQSNSQAPRLSLCRFNLYVLLSASSKAMQHKQAVATTCTSYVLRSIHPAILDSIKCFCPSYLRIVSCYRLN
jgi:hypothetical protein